MSYTGMVPSEHSSGARRFQGAITKTGNSHLRRVLIEAAWHYRHRPCLGNRQRAVHRELDPHVIEIAWNAQLRFNRRYARLSAKTKPPGKVITAVARELVGFIWAMEPPPKRHSRTPKLRKR
jgi:transposase